MDDSDLKQLQSAITQRWSRNPDGKAASYVGKFFDCQRIGLRISGRVHRIHNELGAIKLACLWVLEHRDEFTPKKS